MFKTVHDEYPMCCPLQVVRCNACGIADKLKGGTRNEPVLIDLRRDREQIRQKINNRSSTQLKIKHKSKSHRIDINMVFFSKILFRVRR